MDWQPIETAPRDGRRVLLGWIVNPPTVEHTEISGWKRDHWIGDFTPTHWRPLESRKV